MTKKLIYTAPDAVICTVETRNGLLQASVLLPETEWRDEVEL